MVVILLRISSVKAGTMVILSSGVLHRSGKNLSDGMRRAFMPQYSAGVVTHSHSDELVAFAVPMNHNI
jgi:hypothetical protein